MITQKRRRNGPRAGARRLAFAAAAIVAVASCASPPTPTPRAVEATPASSTAAVAVPPTPGSSRATPGPAVGPSPDPSGWTRAPVVEQPAGFMQVHTDASGQPYMGGCAPCHPAIDTVMTDVVAGPAGLVAVGWILQDFRGATWRSADGLTWTFTGGFPDGTLLTAVATDGRRYVAVGRDGEGATAWSSTDGVAWTRTRSTDAFAGLPQRLTSVVSFRGGFVAGGFRGTDFFTADGAFWTSPDGVTWARAPASPSLADARVVAIAVGGPGLVAVGQAGPADHPGPAIAWTSADGVSWRRVPDSSALDGARIRSIASVPGIGLVAAGESIAGDTGIVWTSRDGMSWERVPPRPDFGRAGIQVRMYDVVAGPTGATVVGTVTEGIQYGVAAVWTSRDGITWTRTPSSAALQDTEMNAATRWRDRVVTVGDRGAPDAYQATAWVGPPGPGE